MTRLAPLLLLLAACSSEPPDDGVEDEGGSSSDSGAVEDEGDESSSSEGGETGEPAPDWPPVCLEASPVSDPTCAAIHIALGGADCDAHLGEGLDCAAGEWSFSAIEVAWWDDQPGHPVDAATVLRTDRIECGEVAPVWLRTKDDIAPLAARVTYQASYGDELVYECAYEAQQLVFDGTTMAWPELGEEASVCLRAPAPPSESDAQAGRTCCLASGTPAESSGLPTTPC